jgi:hypothetical protein
MFNKRSLSNRGRSLIGILLCLIGSATACAADSYDRATGQLTIPTMAIGSATYVNVLLTVGHIVSGPTGGSPNGNEDTYDPATGRLTVPSVTVGSTTYYNVVVTVNRLISVGNVIGADWYDGFLTIPSVSVGDRIFDNVVVTVKSIVGVAGGMPTENADSYAVATGLLSVPAVQVGGTVYTNATVKPGVVSVGGPSFVAQGHWVQTDSTGKTVDVLVLETGEIWSINSKSGGVNKFSNGVVAAAGDSLAGTAADYSVSTGTVVDATVISATVVPLSTISGTSTNSSGTKSFILSYDASFGAANLARLAGSYGWSNSGGTGALTIGSAGLLDTITGAFTSVAGVCHFSGIIAPRASGKNIYNLYATFTSGLCPLGLASGSDSGKTMTGVVYLTATNELIGAAVVANLTGTAFIAAHQ